MLFLFLYRKLTSSPQKIVWPSTDNHSHAQKLGAKKTSRVRVLQHLVVAAGVLDLAQNIPQWSY